MSNSRSLTRRPRRGGRLPFSAVPAAQGLYDPAFEADSCGVAFIADIKGRKSHRLVTQALIALQNMDHRGAAGAEQSSGDGAGITVQVPDSFLRAVAGFELPAPGAYAVGTAFLPADAEQAARVRELIAEVADAEGLRILGWRAVPTDASTIGGIATAVMPTFEQLFLAGANGEAGLTLERLAFCLRKVVEHRAAELGLELYFPSLSTRTLIYKGMLTTHQLQAFFPDLADDRFVSAITLVHSRFSTNTFPSWPLAHPFRLIAHNGEINTIKGNRNWMRTREALLSSDLIPGDLLRLFPVCTPGRQRLGHVRRGARTAAPGRAQPAARGADDGARGVGERDRARGRRDRARAWTAPGATSTPSTPR